MTHSYENETFDEPTSTTKKTSKSMSTPKSPLEKLKKYKNFSSPRSPFSARSLARNSESESEDSISYTGGWGLLYCINKLKTVMGRSVQFGSFTKLFLGSIGMNFVMSEWCYTDNFTKRL